MFEFIPRPGLPDSVRRSKYCGYTPVEGSNSIHRWVYKKGSVLHSKLSCLCENCRLYNFTSCINQGHTGTMIPHTFVEEAASAVWTREKGKDLGADVDPGETVAYEDTNSTRGYSIGHCTLKAYIVKKLARNRDSGLYGSLIQVRSMRPLIGHNCEKQWVAGVNKPSVLVPTNRILMTKFSVRKASRVASEADRDEGEDGTIYSINDRKKEVATVLRRLDTLVPDSNNAQIRAAEAAAAAVVVVVAPAVVVAPVVAEDVVMGTVEEVSEETPVLLNIVPTPPHEAPSGRGRSPNKKRRKTNGDRSARSRR